MDIAYASDLHGNMEMYEKLFSFVGNRDALVLGGDIAPKGFHEINDIIDYQKKFLLGYFIPRIEELKKDVYVMMGNDDARINLSILEKAERDGVLKLLHDKIHQLGELTLCGYPFVPVTPFRLKDWEKGDLEEEKVNSIQTVERHDFSSIKQDFDGIRKKTDPKRTIYVIHTPPFNTKLDIIRDGSHVGSRAVRQFIEEEQPPLTLHGHIHESVEMSRFFMDKIGSTTAVNPGSQHNPFTGLKAETINVVTFDTKKPERIKLFRL